MTNPSETATKLRNLAKWLDRENDESTGNIAREAADTIDRLTSTGEAVAWRYRYRSASVNWSKWVTVDFDPTEAFSKSEYEIELQPLYASPREGHVEVPVEPTEVLWVAFSMEYAVEGYENFAKAYRAMLAALPHNQGETKPEAWDLAARAENGETNL